jgi:hypothetical protein
MTARYTDGLQSIRLEMKWIDVRCAGQREALYCIQNFWSFGPCHHPVFHTALKKPGFLKLDLFPDSIEQVSLSTHLRTGIDPVSETVFFSAL